jgi:hypothetical protein
MIDLDNQPLLVDISGIDRADFGAGRIVTMHAGPWKQPGFDVGIFSFNIGDQLDPVDGATL